MPWLGQVPAVLEAWYPGEEGGNALAAVLFGDVNPSGEAADLLSDKPGAEPRQRPPAVPGGGRTLRLLRRAPRRVPLVRRDWR